MSDDEIGTEAETTTPAETAEVSIEQELGDIFDKANAEESGPARGPDGKFVSRETSATAEPAGEAASADPVSSDPVAPQAPAAWSDDMKAQWAGLPSALQTHILEQEEARQKAIEDSTRLKTYEPIAQALEPVRQTLALNGVDDVTYVRQLVAADQFLRTKPQEAIQWLAKQYGAQVPQPQADEEIDPAFAPFLNKINQLESQLTGFMTAQQQQQERQVSSVIEAFMANPENKYAKRLEQQIVAEIATVNALHPTASPEEKLRKAYDRAVRLDDAVQAEVAAEKSAESERKRQEEAAAKARKAKEIAVGNLSSKGTGGGQTPKTYPNREAELADIYDQVSGAA